MFGYEYIAQTFKAYEVSHVFYIDAILRIAIREMEESGIKCILTHSENSAGYMADGFARATGKPGIAMCQSIGAGNMVGGIYDAYLANSPLIAITGKKVPYYQYKNAYQEADHRLLFEGITKFNADITQPAQLPYLLRQCFREATAGKAKPVHLDISDHMGRTAEVAMIDEAFYAEETYIKNPAYRYTAEQCIIEDAVSAIRTAKKPVIVAGRGAKVSGAGKEIYDFAVLNDIPVVTTPDGRCLIDETDPIWAGCCGLYGMDCANRTIAAADLIIFIGTQANDQTTLDWSCPAISTQVIQIDIDPTEIGRCYPNTVGLLGDAKALVTQLIATSRHTIRPEWREEVRQFVKNTLSEYRVFQKMENMPIRPERLCHEISAVLPDNAVVVADTGYSAQWTVTMLRLKATQQYFRAAGSLGWAFPGSMGIKLGLPDLPVICFTGDGAMYYHIGEMETMARYGIKTVTVVNNNQVFAQCSGDIKRIYKEDKKSAQSRFTFNPTRFSEVAKTFGLNGVTVERPEDIAQAIKEALTKEKSTVIDVITDPNADIPVAFKTDTV